LYARQSLEKWNPVLKQNENCKIAFHVKAARATHRPLFRLLHGMPKVIK
jgi:hypothetical protein